MIRKYALPCSCGETIAVELRHAGGKMSCGQCSANVDVPKLRDLKKLDPIAEVVPARTRGDWSGLQGTLFAVGLLALAIAVGCTYYTYLYKSYYDDFTTAAEQNLNSEEFKNASLVDSWRMWEEFKKIRLESRPLPVHLIARERVEALTKWLTFFGTLAAIGLAFIALSFIVRPRTIT